MWRVFRSLLHICENLAAAKRFTVHCCCKRRGWTPALRTHLHISTGTVLPTGMSTLAWPTATVAARTRCRVSPTTLLFST